MTDSGSEGKGFITSEIWIFSYKNAGILYRRPLFNPWSCVRHALFDVFWTVEQKHPLTAMVMLGIARTKTPIGFI